MAFFVAFRPHFAVASREKQGNPDPGMKNAPSGRIFMTAGQ
jgi:hypothetical protein